MLACLVTLAPQLPWGVVMKLEVGGWGVYKNCTGSGHRVIDRQWTPLYVDAASEKLLDYPPLLERLSHDIPYALGLDPPVPDSHSCQRIGLCYVIALLFGKVWLVLGGDVDDHVSRELVAAYVAD